MKKLYLLSAIVFLTLFVGQNAFGQCGFLNKQENGNYYLPVTGTNPTAGATGNTVGVGPAAYVSMKVQSGANYSFTTCGTFYDNQITGWNSSNTGSSVLYNDDNCGLQAGVPAWAGSFNGTLYIQNQQYNCLNWTTTYRSTSTTLAYTCTPSVSAQGAGNGTWNINCYNAGDATGGSGAWSSNFSGYYTESNLSFNTTNRWSNGGYPSDASGYQGCGVPPTYHSWSAVRTNITAGAYAILTDHDDAGQILINGNYIWNTTACCSANRSVGTFVILPSDVVTFRVSQGGGGAFGTITFNSGAALSAGSLSYSGSTAVCAGYSVPVIGSAANASGGGCASINGYGTAAGGGTTAYQWYLNGSAISGATGNTYTPGVLNTAGTYAYTRTVTDRLGSTATTAAVTIVVQATPTITTVTAGTNPLCNYSTTTLTANGVGGTSTTTTWYTATGGGGINLGTGNTLTAGPGQTYYARVTNSNCPAVEANITLNTETTVPVITAGSGLSVYSNPNQASCKGVAPDVFATGQMPTVTDNCTATIQVNPLPSSANNLSGGLLCWLKADAGVVFDASNNVARWKDISGNGNDAQQTTFSLRPTRVTSVLKGQPVIRFTPSNYLLGINNFTSTNYTIIVVGKYNSGTNARVIGSGNTNWLLGWHGGYPNRLYTNNWIYQPSSYVNDLTPHIYTVTSTGSSTYFYGDGNTLVTNSTAASQLPIGQMELNGGSGSVGGEVSNCDIAEVLVYNRVLTSNERIQIESYLANKYGTQMPLSAMQTTQLISNAATTNFIAADGSGNTATQTSQTETVTSFPGPSFTLPASPYCGASNAITIPATGMQPSGKSLVCSGTNDWFCTNTTGNQTTGIAIGSTWTIEMWAKFPLPANGSWNTLIRGTAYHHMIVAEASGTAAGAYNVGYTAGALGVYQGGFYPCGYNFNTNAPSAGWHHLAAVGQGGYTTFYLDGVNIGTSYAQATDNVISIGSIQGTGTNQQSGSLDEVKIYNVAVPQSTLNTWMTQTATSSHPNWSNMLAYYQFNGNANDTRGLNNGSVQGSATTTTKTSSYYYSWSGPAGASFTNNNTQNGDTTVLTGATNGSYSCYAYLQSGCNSTTTTNTLSPNIPAVAVPTTTTVTGCGSATIYATVGTNGTTCRFYGPNSTTTIAGSGTSYTISSTGSFTYYVTSYNATTGCESAQTAVAVTVSPSFTITMGNTNYNGYGVSCNGGSNGVVTATVTTTNYPLKFVWSNGTTNSGISTTSNSISGLAAGTYNVTISDNGACTNVGTITISAPTALATSLSVTSNYSGFGENCNGASVGAISNTPSGGYGSYTYLWSNSSTVQSPSSLAAGTYTVTVKDGNLCSVTASTSVTQPAVITFTTSVGFACSGSTYTSGSITVNANGGASGVYQYSFDGGSTWQASNTKSGLAQGNYTVQVRDNTTTSCVSSSAVTNITFPAAGTSTGACNYIYVTTNGDGSGSSTSPGTKNCPASLNTALAIFGANSSTRTQILVQQGTYNFSSTLSIPANVTIEGGYDANWVKSSQGGVTIFNINPSLANDGTNGRYVGIQPTGNNFVLKDLTINVQTAGASGTYNNRGISIYGIYTNGLTGFTVSRCTITTGAASAGATGGTPSGTGGGSAGGAGGSAGGYGGHNTCSNCGGTGSSGGYGAGPFGADAGGGGGGNGCANGCNIFGCNASGGNGGSGGNGSNGANALSYASYYGVANASASGGLGVFYAPVTGAQGPNGDGGGGGGGGGNGSGGTCCTCGCGNNTVYAGAGGAGGNGGAGGYGGYGGGSSFAIYSYGGSGTITDCSLNPGSGGAGGAGGTGQYGNGGNGGGGSNCSNGCDGGCGGSGGNGGTGGQGGQGQAGANGYSTTLYSSNGSVVQTGTTVQNDGVVTANWYSGCTKSQIDLTKTSGSNWGGFIGTDPAFVNDLTSATTSSTTSASPISIYYPSTTAIGSKAISLGSTTLNNFITIIGNRLVDPASNIINTITAPCSSGSISLGTSLAGQQANITAYDWKISLVSNPTTYVYTSSTASPGTVPAPSGGWVAGATYQVRLRLQENCCGWSIPIYQTFTILSVPANAGAITGSTSVCANTNTVSYSIASVATATSYAWTVTGSGTLVSGNGTTSIVVNWGSAGAGTVSVLPSNACGNAAASTTVNVTVQSNPTVVINPSPSNAIICNGSSITLTTGSTAGTGGNGSFTYLWSSTETTANITKSPTTSTTYTVTITEGVSGCTASQNQSVTVSNIPATYTVTGGSHCISPGTTVGLSGSVSGVNYQLVQNGTNLNSPVAGTGSAISFGLQTTPATYTVVASNANGACSSLTMTGNAVVYPNPTVNTVSNQLVCNGQPSTLITFGGTNASTYNWSNNTTSIGLAASATGVSSIPAFTVTNATTSNVTATISVTPVSSNSCSGTAGTFTITAYPSPSVNTVSNQAICNGLPTTAITFSGTNATSYNWSNNTTSIGLAASATGVTGIPAFTVTNATSTAVTATITVTPVSANGCSGTATTFTITVNPSPSLSAVTSQAKCNGTPTSAITFSGINASTYNWANNTTSIGLAASGTGVTSIPAFTVTNATTSNVTATITVTPVSSNSCSGTSGTFTITAYPSPSINTVSNQIVCNGQLSTAITFSGTNASTYNWSNNTTSIGLAASATGVTGIPVFTVTNTTASAVTATISVTPVSANSCSGTATTFTITANPSPTSTYTVTGGGSYCSGGAGLAVGLSGSQTGVTYQLFINGVGSSTVSGTGSAITFGNQSTAATYTVIGTNNATGCTATMTGNSVISINIQSVAPTSVTVDNNNFCPGAFTNIILSYSGATLGTGAVATWYSGSCGGTSVGTGNNLSITSPTTSTNYYVQIAGTCNTVCSGVDAVTVKTQSTTPTISASSNNICTGSSVNINVLTGTLGTNAQWRLYSGASCCSGLIQQNTSGSFTVNPVGTTQYFVRAEGDCNNTTAASVTVTVSATPSTAPISLSTSSSSVCPADAVTLTTNGGSLGLGAQWYLYATTSSTATCSGFVIGTQIANNSTGVFSVTPGSLTSNGAAYYFVRAENNCGTTACANASETVNPSPTLTGVTSATSSVCYNTGVTINLAGLLPSTAQTVTYTVGGVTQPTQTITSAAGGTASFTTTNLTGGSNVIAITKLQATGSSCSTTFSSGNSVTVTTNPLPTLTGVSAGTPSVCTGTGGTINLTGLLSNTAQTITYTVGGVNQPTQSITSSGTSGTFTTTSLTSSSNAIAITQLVANGTGCTQTFSSGNSTTVTVVAQPDPPQTATPSPNVPSTCDGATLTLSGAASGGNTGLSCAIEYQYSTNGGSSYTFSGTTIPSFTGFGGQTCIIQARRNSCQSGCTTSGWNTVASWVIVAQPTSPSSAPASPNTALVCNGTTLTLSGPATGGNAGTGCGMYYQYSTDGGTTWSTASTTIPSFAAVGTLRGQANIIRAYRDVCSNYCTGPTTPVNVATWTVYSQPTVALSPISNSVCTNGSVTVTATPTLTAITPTSYAWYSSTNNSTFTTSVQTSTVTSYSPSTSSAGTTYYSVTLTYDPLTGCNTINPTSTATVTVNAQPSVSVSGGGTVCTGVSVTLTPTVTNGVGSPSSYTWYSSSSSGGPFTTVVGTSANYSPTTSSAGTSYYEVGIAYASATGCNAATSVPESVTVLGPQTATTWTGAIDNNWNTIGNWSNCVPGTITDVTIPATAPNFPTTYTGNNSPVCNSLTVQTASGSYATVSIPSGVTMTVTSYVANDGNFTVANNGTLTVGTNIANTHNLTMSGSNSAISLSGDWTNSGTFTSGTGSVTFNGTGTSNITSGSTSSANKFNIVNVNKSGSGMVTLLDNTYFSTSSSSSVLNVNNGTFEVPSGITVTLKKVNNTTTGTINVKSTGLLKIP